MRQLPLLLLLLLLLLIGSLWSAEKSPLVLDASNRPSVITAADVIRLPSAGPFYTGIYPTATADRDISLPDATTTLAGYSVAGTWTAAQNFSAGTTVIATADINSGAIDGTAIGATAASSVASTTLSSTGTASLASTSGQLEVGPTANIPNLGLLRIGGSSSNFLVMQRFKNDENDLEFYYNFGGSISGTVPSWQNNVVIESFLPSGTSNIIFSAFSGSHIWQTGSSRTQRMSLSGTALTLSSGINLAMLGASTLTTGTGLTTAAGPLLVTGAGTAVIEGAYNAGLRIHNASGITGITFRRDDQTFGWSIHGNDTALGDFGLYRQQAGARFAALYFSSAGAATFGADVTLADGADIATNATTGSQIATASTQKLALWGATPVVQPTAVADATDAATAITQLNALLSRMRTIGLIAP